jgi:hypothetical protein
LEGVDPLITAEQSRDTKQRPHTRSPAVLEALEGPQADVGLLGEFFLGQGGEHATFSKCRPDRTELLVDRLTVS